MNSEGIVCPELDNTNSCKSKDNTLANQNSECSSGHQLLHGDGINAKPDYNESFNQEEDNNEEFDIEVMTGSYGEISLDQELLAARAGVFHETNDYKTGQGNEENKLDCGERIESNRSTESKRPNSLILTKSTKLLPDNNSTVPGSSENGENWKRIHKSQQTSDSQATSVDGSPSLSSEEYAIYSPTHRRTGSDTSGLSDLQGTITVDGDMVSFFAEDLEEKIKLSSPISRWTDSPSFPVSRSSTPSLHQQVLQSQTPLIDPGAIADLEVHAKKVATCVDTMLENLSETLQTISSLTVDYMDTYKNAVCKTCDSVDVSIKTMYQLMAKCEELGKSVQPLYKIAQDIKNIKRVLDQFENAVEKKS